MHVGIKIWKPGFAGLIVDQRPWAIDEIDNSLTFSRAAEPVCAKGRDPVGKRIVVASQRTAATSATCADAIGYCGIDDVKCREGLAYNWFCGI
jgi:hypothetical protein